jgi:predicted lipoprotein with Yx(FWY)xxD motif
MRLKSSVSVVVAVALVGTLAAPVALAGDKDKKKSKELTVIGMLVDTKCYGMNHDNFVADHMTPKGKMTNCAQACANMGIPVAVLKDGEKSGDVYILIAPAQALAEHMARTVKVIGMESLEGAIIPNKVFVKNAAGKWEEVKIATMM